MAFGDKQIIFNVLTCGTWHDGMRTHEATQFGAMMIRTHEQFTLIFVAAWIAGRRLCGSC